MRDRWYPVVAVVVLALLAAGGLIVAPIAGAGFVPATSDGGTAGSAATDGVQVHQQNAPQQGVQQQDATACNYTELYDETIDAVVTIQSGGGQGSGFVTQIGGNDTGAYVVTNAHVVGDASNVMVSFNQGEFQRGQVVGSDVSSDLAVVQVAETPGYVEALPLTDDEPRHGQRVAALGSPFGLEATITHGIVSGLDRSLPTNRGYTIPNVIQTDAPISSGNSGGPLLTCGGEVVGVNTAGIAAQGAENIGFAVPASTIERVVPSLVATGEFTHPTLGVGGATVTPAIVQANDLDVNRGIMVVSVDDDAPAAAVLQGIDRVENVSGQRVPIGGDVIVAVEGQPVASGEDVASVLLAETRPGEEVELTIVRDGQRTTVTTTVTDRPEPQPARP